MGRETSYDAGSILYRNSGSVPLASRLSVLARRRMFEHFMGRFQPTASTTILDVGVTSDCKFAESNYFEKLYPFPEQITAVGTEDGSHLMREYPGLGYQRVRPGEHLPFADRQFDIVFSNAVVEHTGSRVAQAAFVAEVCRVGKAYFITTPNRWFPVEHHTGLPLVHYLPRAMFRRIIRKSRYAFWASESNLNILTAQEFKHLFPAHLDPDIQVVKLAGIPCNLIATGASL